MPGEVLKVDTGCIVAFTSSVHYDIQFVGGVKTPCLVVKVCFMQACKDQAKYGFKPYQSADWQDVFYHTEPEEEKKREVFWAGLVTFWMGMEFNE